MDARKRQIRRRALELLKAAKPFMVHEDVLHSDICMVMKPNPTLSDFEQVISKMEKDRVIIRLRGDEETKTKITDEGEAELLQ